MRTLFFLLLASGLPACRTASPSTAATARIATIGSAELLYKQQATITLSPAYAVQATLNEVSDSRCPATVQCIVAGYVAVGISLNDGSASPHYLHLCLGCNARNQPDTGDSVAVTLHQKPYWARLLAVRPAPASPSNNPTPVATLRLRPQ
jgi:hypothetical protein